VHNQTHANAAAQIAYDILVYLTIHPKAHDTLEGILEWWLLEQHIRREAKTVKDGLAILVARGFILQCQSGDARSHYSLNQTRLDEITEFLNAREKRGS
jgi:hypothetical protein